MPLPLIKTDDIEVLRTQFQAWMDGVNARFLGMAVADQPHPSRSAAGDAWENGWDVCNQHLKDISTDEGYNICPVDATLRNGSKTT